MEIINCKKALDREEKNLYGINDRIDRIYQRQQEVVIGKRNVNCLSCYGGLIEPDQNATIGTDGKVYRGRVMSPSKSRSPSVDKSEKKYSSTLLNLKWEYLKSSPRAKKMEQMYAQNLKDYIVQTSAEG